MKKVMSLAIAMAFLASMVAASPVSAANLDVPADYATIQAAIYAASDGFLGKLSNSGLSFHPSFQSFIVLSYSALDDILFY